MPGLDTLNAAMPRHFLDLDGIDGDTLRAILEQSAVYKRAEPRRRPKGRLPGRPWR